MLKKWLSYFIPINVESVKSKWSKTLEVTWANGQLVLDSRNTNYSYGSLQRILRIGLLKIGFARIKKMDHILVLGVAGGSVVKTLVNEVRFTKKITGVEIDADVITIANTYFELDKVPNLTMILDDAFEFILKTKETYDLIIIDIFQDTKMPNFLFESFFVDRILDVLNRNGVVLFNTMCLTDADNLRNSAYLELFDKNRVSVQTIPRIEAHNELIIVEKKS